MATPNPADAGVRAGYESPTTEGDAQANAIVSEVKAVAETIAKENADGTLKAIASLRDEIHAQNEELAKFRSERGNDATEEKLARSEEAYEAKVAEVQSLTKRLAEEQVGSELQPVMSEWQRHERAVALDIRRTRAIPEVNDSEERYKYEFLKLFAPSTAKAARSRKHEIEAMGAEAAKTFARNTGAVGPVYAETEISSDQYQGGLYIPRDIEERIMPRSMQRGAIREVADVVSVPQGRGNSRGFPVQNTRAEAKFLGSQDEDIEYMEVGEDAIIDVWLHPVMHKTRVLRTWWGDAPQFHVQDIMRKQRLAIMDRENKAFVDGDNVKQPYGVLSLPKADVSDSHNWKNVQRVKSGADGKFPDVLAPGAGSGTPKSSAQPLIEASSALWDDKINERAAFICRRKTRTAIRVLVDSSSNLVYRESIMAGHPAEVCGHRLLLDDFMPELTSGTADTKGAVLFITGGAYVILEKAGEPLSMTVDTLDEDQHDIVRMYRRCGGDLVDRWGACVVTFES